MPYVPGAFVHGVRHIADVYNSSNVYANFVPIALHNDPQGPEAAVLNAITAPTFKAENQTTEAVEGDADSDSTVAAEQKRLVEEGVLTQAEVDAGNGAGAKATATDTTVAVASTGTVDGSVTVSATVDDTVLYVSPLTGITWTVKMVTKQPGVVFPYDVATVAPANGLTVQQACDSLRLLVINVIDPIKKQFPDMFLTNTLRNKGNGAPKSQHPKAQACDIQYSKASKADYFTRAQWIRDNIAFDQFLLEYKTTGTKKPWHHLSFVGESNRAQVCTFMNDRNAKGPGVTGLYDLSGVE
jgi:hypothetical protein